MEISTHDFWTVLHGMGFGALFMLAFSGALAELYRMSAPGAPVQPSSREQTLLAVYLIAMVVLAPESITAVRAAEHNELQKSLNLALGSSLATIGLTIPAVAVTNVFIGKQIEIGLSARDTLLLALTLFLSLLTFGSGRTNILSGLVHLVVFATFLFLVFVP